MDFIKSKLTTETQRTQRRTQESVSSSGLSPTGYGIGSRAIVLEAVPEGCGGTFPTSNSRFRFLQPSGSGKIVVGNDILLAAELHSLTEMSSTFQ